MREEVGTPEEERRDWEGIWTNKLVDVCSGMDI